MAVDPDADLGRPAFDEPAAPTTGSIYPQPAAHAWPTVAENPGRWLRWYRGRPFWGGLFTLLSGAEILVTVLAPLPVMIHLGMLGLAGFLVPIIVLLCGLLLWFNPAQHIFYAVMTALLTLASWVTSNLSGFFLGLILGLLGAAFGFAWIPSEQTVTVAGASTEPPDEPDPRHTSIDQA